jgi:hypothetical protein
LVPTLHSKIRSYVSNHNLDAKQLKEIMQRLHGIVEEQDVASLMLLLKELIPNYSPGSKMPKAAMQVQPNLANPDRVQVPSGQVERVLSASLTPATRIN